MYAAEVGENYVLKTKMTRAIWRSTVELYMS